MKPQSHFGRNQYNDSCPPSGPAMVPKTGKTKCYNNSGNPRDCASTGEDGEYQKGVATTPRFTGHGNGTVTDNLTGLMWTKDAQQIPGYKTWQAALDACNNLVYPVSGGYDDWRLPNQRELQSLMHFGFYDPAVPNTAGTGKWSEGDPFINVKYGFVSSYWSSTTIAYDTNDAWVVHMTYGPGGALKTDENYVWPVRGGQ